MCVRPWFQARVWVVAPGRPPPRATAGLSDGYWRVHAVLHVDAALEGSSGGGGSGGGKGGGSGVGSGGSGGIGDSGGSDGGVGDGGVGSGGSGGGGGGSGGGGSGVDTGDVGGDSADGRREGASGGNGVGIQVGEERRGLARGAVFVVNDFHPRSGLAHIARYVIDTHVHASFLS